MNDFDVVVVGAGLSGLAAAQRVSQTAPNCRVCIVEARDRVGGRTESVLSVGVDVGAQWIGPTHSEMIGLCRQFGLELIEQQYPVCQDYKGNRLVECVGYPVKSLSTPEAQSVDEYMCLLSTLMDEIDVNHPWEHPRAKEWDDISIEKHICSNVLSLTGQFELKLFAQTVLACDPSCISLLCFLFYVKSGGGMEALGDGDQGAQRWRVSGGMQQVSMRLCEELVRNNVEIRLNYAIGSCTMSPDGMVTLKSSKQGTDDGADVVIARRVIWAIPPQLLAHVQFDSNVVKTYPVLEDKIKLGHLMLPGYAAKIIVAFERAFWLDETPTKEFTHFAELGFIHNLFHSKLNDGTAALVGLITGKAAIDFARLNDNDRKSAVLQQLSTMYTTNPHESLKVVFYQDKVWSNEEFSGGCFAGIFPPGRVLSSLGASLRLPCGPFSFCSTETSPQFYGYMEGAIRSGYRAGLECIDSLQECSDI